MIQKISRECIEQKISAGEHMVLVEISPVESYDHVHLPKAIHLRPGFSDFEAASILGDHGRQLIVYSEGDQPLDGELRRLYDLGYKAIFHYPGGKKDWMDGGLAIDGTFSPTRSPVNPHREGPLNRGKKTA